MNDTLLAIGDEVTVTGGEYIGVGGTIAEYAANDEDAFWVQQYRDEDGDYLLFISRANLKLMEYD